ncbi:hypothetical protein [Polymorphospora rubra]|uniref:Uncharacterized protein n=1 Tax=Polymorphospora rubra TaxID=338584 RepID=A0A810N1S0_9ACTN|nr:hypothetical protein [Polymorphospora rubra]BCJ66830.1 hypothetical protein Prubr_38510 [Polymorphospora rubra]
MTHEWRKAPVGIDAEHWVTRPDCRSVLAVAHTITSCHRLLDVVEYVEDDPRVQVVFTVGPDVFSHGVVRYLESLGALVLPWQHAVRERFDLGLAASYGGLHEVHAPLVVMAHGAGHGKPVSNRGPGTAVQRTATAYGLDSQRLTRDGRVLAAAVALSHDDELDVLDRQCPEALDAAVVVGDPCFDRIVVSLPDRPRYRRALGVDEHQELVVVSSTWGRNGLFGHWPDLLSTVMDQLPAHRFRVGALLHPAVWHAHGHRQIRAWLRDCREAGLLLLEPTEDWRALVVAADYLIGDHGSVTTYAAAIGRRVLIQPGLAGIVTGGSPQALVTSTAGRLDPGRRLLPQLEAAAAMDPTAVVARLTSRPGQAATILRRTLYRLLDLTEPSRHRRVEPVDVPRLPGRERSHA